VDRSADQASARQAIIDIRNAEGQHGGLARGAALKVSDALA
jgi:hypothetical protein